MFLEDLSNKLKEANEKNDENAIKDAKDEIGKALTKSGDASGASRLTEIRRLKGKKITYVRSDKIKNHWRSYSLNVDDNKKSLRTNKGKLDKDRLGKQFKDVQTKIKQEWKKDYGTSVAGHEIFFGEIIDEINESLKWSINEQNADPEEINFDVSTEARLLRFYAGASGGWTFDPVKGNFGITGKVSASIALAEAKFMSSAYWPDEAGFKLEFAANSKHFDLGSVRAKLELKSTAFAGASACGSLLLQIELKNGGLRFKGTDGTDKNRKPLTASGKLFAGVEAGGDVTGAVEWDNPEKRKSGKPAWSPFLSIGYGGAVSAGFGAEAEFVIHFDNGKFIFRAKAGLVIGVGGRGSAVGFIDAGTIWNFVQFVYYSLRREDFHFLDFITTKAFRAVTMLSVWSIEVGEDIEKIGKMMFDELEESVEYVINIWRDIINVMHSMITLLSDNMRRDCVIIMK